MKIEWPLLINIYRGEKRMLIIPVVTHVSGMLEDSDWFVSLPEDCSALEIGRAVIEAIRVIKEDKAPDFNRMQHTYSWQINTKYRSWYLFWKNNDNVRVRIYENGEVQIYSMVKSSTVRCVNSDIAKKLVYTYETMTAEEYGQAVLEVFAALDERKKQSKPNPYPPKELTLLDESRLTITPPKNSHFEDTGDMGAMECYQSYSYIPKEGDEASAIFYLTIAPEIDCDLSTDNVRACWEEIYGAADMFEMKEESKGIYTHQAIMKNKEQYRKSYFLQMEEDLILECGMTVYMPNRRKKLCEKMETLFEEFAAGCKFTS